MAAGRTLATLCGSSASRRRFVHGRTWVFVDSVSTCDGVLCLRRPSSRTARSVAARIRLSAPPTGTVKSGAWGGVANQRSPAAPPGTSTLGSAAPPAQLRYWMDEVRLSMYVSVPPEPVVVWVVPTAL